MGCDIHFYVEKWSDEDVIPEGPLDISDARDSIINNTLKLEKDHRWITADKWIKEDDDYWTNYSFYRDRNYDLFAKLADVRNYGSDITPLSEPRGVPEDASYAYKYMVKKMNGDGHSHSYFTLDELLNSGVNWEDFSKDFVNTIEKMKMIDSDTSKIRCVFFFDN